MKSITEILCGAQPLFNFDFGNDRIFEEYLNDEHKEFLAILQVIEDCVKIEEKQPRMGRPPYFNFSFFRAFLAQSFFRLDTTKDLISRLKVDCNLRLICKFAKIPSKATFSRRFAQLAQDETSQKIHEKLICTALKDRLVMHICRDSTAIPVRSKPIKIKKSDENSKKKRGRPRKDEIRTEKPLKTIEKRAV